MLTPPRHCGSPVAIGSIVSTGTFFDPVVWLFRKCDRPAIVAVGKMGRQQEEKTEYRSEIPFRLPGGAPFALAIEQGATCRTVARAHDQQA
jgi:hypothetical protein